MTKWNYFTHSPIFIHQLSNSRHLVCFEVDTIAKEHKPSYSLGTKFHQRNKMQVPLKQRYI